jgi:hypothetical protein
VPSEPNAPANAVNTVRTTDGEVAVSGTLTLGVAVAGAATVTGAWDTGARAIAGMDFASDGVVEAEALAGVESGDVTGALTGRCTDGARREECPPVGRGVVVVIVGSEVVGLVA